MGKKKNPSVTEEAKSKVVPLFPDLPPTELKRRFAKNLDWLLKATGLSRKEASEAMDIDYRVVRRLVTAGVSRVDDRNKETLDKLEKYFGINVFLHLWHSDRGNRLLQDKEGKFVSRFRTRLEKYRENLIEELSLNIQAEIKLLDHALGKKSVRKRDELQAKFDFLISSDLGKRFEAVLDDYCQFANYREAV